MPWVICSPIARLFPIFLSVTRRMGPAPERHGLASSGGALYEARRVKYNVWAGRVAAMQARAWGWPAIGPAITGNW